MVDELPISPWISLLLCTLAVQQLAAEPGKICSRWNQSSPVLVGNWCAKCEGLLKELGVPRAIDD